MDGKRLEDSARIDTIGGKAYLTAGILLTALKLLIDYEATVDGFGREWTPWVYVIPIQLLDIPSMPAAERTFYLTMAAISLPFVVVGVTLTLRRLRDAARPPWLAALFFLPIPFNDLFFLILAALPTRTSPERAALADLHGDALPAKKGPPHLGPTTPRGSLGALLPESDAACALASIFATIPITMLLGYLSVTAFSTYGWGLFVALPFGMPMASVMIYGLRKPRGIGECILLGVVWFFLMFASLLVFAFEGIVCLILLIPLALPISILGAVAGYGVQLIPWSRRSPRALLILVTLLPTLIGAEGLTPRTPPLFPVSTAVEVDAPPDRVWKHVVAFSELPPPDDWLFRTGVAYPVRATVDGRGPGAIRRCVFSTGPFVEPIEIWDEPRLLQFSVTSGPPPMKEWSPFADIHPPHLENYLVSRRGQFRLEPLPGGRTRLEGTTWYHHTMWPASYWKVWSDGIIRRIHGQVLRHVKRLAEADSPTPHPAETHRP